MVRGANAGERRQGCGGGRARGRARMHVNVCGVGDTFVAGLLVGARVAAGRVYVSGDHFAPLTPSVLP